MSNQKISVVVPAYNNETWLPRSVDSLLHQSHPDLEIILVNRNGEIVECTDPYGVSSNANG